MWKALVLVVLCIARPASAQSAEETRFRIVTGGYITAAFLDASETAYCSGQGRCHEINPILSPIVERHGVVAAMTVKGAFHAGILGIATSMHKERPKTATAFMVALLAAQVFVDVHNMRTLR